MNTSTAATSSMTTENRIRQSMQQHPLLFFFLLAYAISWILSIPYILAEWGLIQGDMTIVFVLKSFGPFAAALIMTRITQGQAGIKALRDRIRQWRAAWVWYGLILLVIPALIIIGIAVQPGKLAGFSGVTPTVFVTYLFTYVLVFFGGGPLGEEPGWRGYALPRLQEQHGPLTGTLILSALWTCWHLPDFLTSAQGGGPGTGWGAFLTNFPIFLLLVTFLAILFTWIYNACNGSVFMTILAHASVNTPQVAIVPLFPAVDTTALNLAALIGFGAAAILLLIFTRGRLGYQRQMG